MHRFRALIIFGAVVLAGGCQTAKPFEPKPAVIVEPPAKSDAWTRIASETDLDKIRRVGSAWEQAIADARGAGFRSDVAAEGNLLKVGAALPRPSPTPGSYECRLVRLGRYTTRTRAFEKFKPFFCYVEVDGDLLTIVKQTGSQRPAGRLWEDDSPTRLIFLGSVALGNEEQPLAYGENHGRDMAGVFERIAPFKWRLVIPWPRGQSKLDVFELTPVAEQPKPA